MKTSWLALALLSAVLTLQLTGCSPKPRLGHLEPQDLTSAEQQLADTATAISNSLQELAEIDRAVHPQVKLPAPTNPELLGMGQLGSIDWNGPVEPLVKKLTEITHYHFKVLGNPPALPILISLTVKDAPIAEIIRNINFQCGRKANIVIYPKPKIVELRYHKTT